MKNSLHTLMGFLVASGISFTAMAGSASGAWSSGTAAGVSYDIYRPANSGRAPSALMVSLHGCSQTNDELEKGGNWESAADKYNMTVVLPAVPNGGVILGCWDYYGANHDDSSGDSGAVVKMTQALLQDSSLMIDPAHVFVSGISSGAGEAYIVGCLRPDIFSGIGLNSTPVLGSGMMEIQSGPSETADQTAKLCAQMAGSHANSFAVQKTSIIYDSADPVVNPKHSQVSSAAFQELYGTTKSAQIIMSQLPGTNTSGSGEMYGDANNNVRVTVIVNTGLGHAWAAGGTPAASSSNSRGSTGSSWPGLPSWPLPGTGSGSDGLPTWPGLPSGGLPGLPGASNNYINTSSVDYPMYLGSYFLSM